MRFGQTLSNSVYAPWKDKYLNYDRVKKLLREEDTSPQGRANPEGSWTERDEENFADELTNVELEKVSKHQQDTFNALRDRAAACEAKLKHTQEQPPENEEEKKKIAQDTLTELDSIVQEVTELRKFSRINYTGFLKLAKKHDRRRGSKYRVRPLLQSRLKETPFNTEDYQPLLYRLSGMYRWARQTLEGEDAVEQESKTSVRPQDVYTARKFWVHMDNLLEVKTHILRRLPVLVYNPQSFKVVDSSQKDPTINSIYFDNGKFDLYSGKVAKTTEAGSLRLRWTGQLHDNPEIVLEKKVVSDEAGSKDIRVQLKEKYIKPFLKGEYMMEKQIKKLEDRVGADSEEVKSLKANIEEIQNFVKEQKLEPVLRASYARSAFQIPGDDRVRISIDTDLAFIREDALDTDRPCRDPEDWHRADIDNNRTEYPYSSVKKGEISRFQHAILEIKFKDTKYTQNSAWLQDLMTSHLVKEAPKFSKFVHGVAQLFDDYVNIFPFWLTDLENDIRREPEHAFQEQQDKQAKQAHDEKTVGSYLPGSKLESSYKGTRFGSPSTKVPERRSSAAGSPSASRSMQARPSQLESTAEEHDSDDDGAQGSHGVDVRSSGKGLRSFLPAFSNSRYARRRRQGREDAPLPPGVRDPGNWIKDQGTPKVEAKVWLANQRTFIKWQHIAVLLATLSLGLYNAAGVNNNVARALAVVYTCFAVFAGLWGWGMYLWRSKLITERSGRDFDNMIGPIIISVGLACALVLNFAFKYTAAVKKDRDTEGSSPFNFSLGYQEEL